MRPDDSTGALLWLPICGSTNDEARDRLDDLSVLAVGSEEQTSGRGRRGRAWHSPAGGGLYLTCIVRERVAPRAAGVLPLLAGVVVARLCERWTTGRARPRLKWPNDVLLVGDGAGNGKVAGILCESRIEGGRLTALLGIGLNLRAPPGGFPEGVPGAALETSLDARTAAGHLVTELSLALDSLPPPTGDPFPGVIAAWLPMGPTPGTPMRVGDRAGRFAGLSPEGALLLDTDLGCERFDAGEVFEG